MHECLERRLSFLVRHRPSEESVFCFCARTCCCYTNNAAVRFCRVFEVFRLAHCKNENLALAHWINITLNKCNRTFTKYIRTHLCRIIVAAYAFHLKVIYSTHNCYKS